MCENSDKYLHNDHFDKDGDGIADKTEKEIESQLEPKFESVREAYRSTDGFWSGVGEVIRNTAAGRNTVGRVTGFALDVATVVFPQGSKIDQLRKRGKQALNLNKDKNDMKNAIVRAFTRDGGGFFRVRNEDDEITATSVGAFVVRVVVVGLVVYGLHLLGVPVTELADIFPDQ